jgi:alkylation response protein AidB-like acyl-CoA dehydrogenase
MDPAADPTSAAVAKIVAGEAATNIARHAHQICGALGTAEEFDLQLFTRRLLSWRDEYGNEASWARLLGGALVSGGSHRLWEWLSDSP